MDQLPDIPLHEYHTFQGDKSTLSGKIAAATSALQVFKHERQFLKILEETAPDLVICTFQSIWDFSTIRALRSTKIPFILVLHDAKFHPGDGYPFPPVSGALAG